MDLVLLRGIYSGHREIAPLVKGKVTLVKVKPNQGNLKEKGLQKNGGRFKK
jgi:hypothetical protein